MHAGGHLQIQGIEQQMKPKPFQSTIRIKDETFIKDVRELIEHKNLEPDKFTVMITMLLRQEIKLMKAERAAVKLTESAQASG